MGFFDNTVIFAIAQELFGRFFCKALTTVRPPKPESKTAIGCGEAIVSFRRGIVRGNNEILQWPYRLNLQSIGDI